MTLNEIKRINYCFWYLDSVQIKSWQRTSGPCEIIETGILWLYDTEIWKTGEGNGLRMCTRLQKSWTTTPALDRWHPRMDWDEDQWSGSSSGRSWSLERDTMRRQPFRWRKALNDDDLLNWTNFLQLLVPIISLTESVKKYCIKVFLPAPKPFPL